MLNLIKRLLQNDVEKTRVVGRQLIVEPRGSWWVAMDSNRKIVRYAPTRAQAITRFDRALKGLE